MSRRPAAVLLSAAIAIAGLIGAPCVTRACAMVQARQMDCCKATGAGIRAPRCCTGSREVSRQATPATVTRVANSPAPAMSVATMPVVAQTAEPTHALRFAHLPNGTAPPGGTLIAQHTLLLL